MTQKFFPPRPPADPKIYAYELIGVPNKKGWVKVGYTINTVQDRIVQQVGTAGLQYRILLELPAMRKDGGSFMDHDVHRMLVQKGFKKDQEWFECKVKDVEAAYTSVVTGELNVENRHLSFGMRPEQSAAVEKTAAYLNSYKKENRNKTPHFLWNAKMRFGKTFASYQLAKQQGWKRVLVLTFKPAVENSWREDLMSHTDFEGWQFFNADLDEGLTYETVDKTNPFVYFGSFQNHLPSNNKGKVKEKNKWVHEENWDCIIFDEYHYGAWRESAKELFEGEEDKIADGIKDEMEFSEAALPIKTGAYLYLSGTPFRAIQSGEFIEEQIFNWTYSDEQRAKEEWKVTAGPNPYESLPRMVMMTYQMPDAIREIAMDGEFDEFDLNTFFSAKGKGDKAEFVYEDEVQKWLDLIRGAFQETTVDNLKLGAKKPPMPFSHAELLSVLNHTLWFMPSVASCHAMKNLLEKRHSFYNSYKVVVAAGIAAGQGASALKPVEEAMDDPLHSKTITLSCGKLMTGVSVKPWTGIFMLRNLSTPETYFQAAFRVQTPWTVKNPDSKSPNKEEVIKQECYVFDFAPNRALRQIADYSCRLNVSESNPEKNVQDFIHFLPVLAYDGSAMKQIDAAGILDMAMSGTTATLLARRWESALLVNVDNNTLKRLMDSKEAMDALMSIEGFRSLNQDIETIINKSESVDKKKKEQAESGKEPSKKDKKEMSDEEKEMKSVRKQIQEKLIKFATRVPVFMYLTDFREHTLKDVITELEPGLFKKVTGLTKKDFELLVSLGVFNSALMNDAVYKFKRYEDASLIYSGINRHEDEAVGLFDTVISREEFTGKKEDAKVFINNPAA